MAILKGLVIVPPGGWKYTQPETRVQFSGATYEELRSQVIKHRAYKNFPIDRRMDLDIQRQICAGLTSEYCYPEPGDELPAPS